MGTTVVPRDAIRACMNVVPRNGSRQEEALFRAWKGCEAYFDYFFAAFHLDRLLGFCGHIGVIAEQHTVDIVLERALS